MRFIYYRSAGLSLVLNVVIATIDQARCNRASTTRNNIALYILAGQLSKRHACVPSQMFAFAIQKVGLARLSFIPTLYVRNRAWYSALSRQKHKLALDFFLLGSNLNSAYHYFKHRNGYFTFYNSAGLTLRISKYGFITVFLRATHLHYYISRPGFRYLNRMIKRILFPALRFKNKLLPSATCLFGIRPKLEQLQFSLHINAEYLSLVRTFGKLNPFLLALALEQLCAECSHWQLLNPRIKFSNSDPENYFGSRGLSTYFEGKRTLIRILPNLSNQLTAVSPSFKTLLKAQRKFYEFCTFLHNQNARLQERYNTIESPAFLCKRFFSFGGIK